MAAPDPTEGQGQAAARYYDEWTQRYLDTYGDIIQAFRTRKPEQLLRSIIRASGMGYPMRVLDAGCGVCGPAVFFARQARVRVDAVTVSEKQVELALERVRAEGLQDQVAVQQGDFHHLASLYPPETFDLVLFLESLGHSPQPGAVLKQVNTVLRKGGGVYIKDFFFKHSHSAAYQDYIRQVVSRVNEHYAYQVLDLEPLIRDARALGWEIEFIRPLPFATEIQTRARFESAYGIRLYEGMPELPYAEWLELKFRKVTEPTL
jgi:ubiquinone/menaquinone biosynthesis C-methylase UbiE